ncbi:MAG: cobalamin biosynthesis protein [Nitrospirae bacterium]|nr:cobalamin biosynthesis protein [Nitrospirota bacterium]
MRKTAIIYITDNGLKLAERLKSFSPGAEIAKYAPDVVEDLWRRSEELVFIMASGIVVRTIAPLLKDKRTDPAVVVLDEAGRYAVSLAGGHLGGANELAREIAAFLGSEAVITTASDVNGLPPLDLWAREHDLVIEDWSMLPLIGTRFVNNGALRVYEQQGSGVGGQGSEIKLPDEFLRVAEPRFADVIISNQQNAYAGPSLCAVAGDDCSIETCRVKGQLYLRPRNLVVGIGCNSGTSQEEIEDAVRSVLDSGNLSFLSLGCIATIDIKGSEPGLSAFARKYDLPLHVFRSAELNGVEGIERSEVVFKATGANAVAEPAALLAAGTNDLLVRKQKKGNVTVAVSAKTSGVRSQQSEERGRIFIVGTGPGSLEHITPAARDAIKRSDVIVGYGTYLDLIKELLKDKEVVSTGMTQEVDRCRKAVELAQAGKTVSVISGGDPGVYAMAGLIFEILKAEDGKVRGWEDEKTEQSKTIPTSQFRNFSTLLPSVEVIPGISALNAAASRLGAPLMHDFACISLSDRLTPWEMIERRLEAAAAADFVIVLYNPRSKGRAGHLNRAREIILKHRDAKTAVGLVKGAMREQETVIVTDLENMQDTDVDMQTTVIIGNSKTFVWNDFMITPRGYDV